MKSLRKILRRGLMLGLAASVGVTGSLWGDLADFQRDVPRAVELSLVNAGDTLLLDRYGFELIQEALRSEDVFAAKGTPDGKLMKGSRPDQVDAIQESVCMLVEDPQFQEGFRALYKTSRDGFRFVGEDGDYDYLAYVQALDRLISECAERVSNPLALRGLFGLAAEAWGNVNPNAWVDVRGGQTPLDYLISLRNDAKAIDPAGPGSLGDLPHALARDPEFLRQIEVDTFLGNEAVRKRVIIRLIAHVIASRFTPEEACLKGMGLLPTSMRDHLAVYDLIRLNERGNPWGALCDFSTKFPSATRDSVLRWLGKTQFDDYFIASILVPSLFRGVPGKLFSQEGDATLADEGLGVQESLLFGGPENSSILLSLGERGDDALAGFKVVPAGNWWLAGYKDIPGAEGFIDALKDRMWTTRRAAALPAPGCYGAPLGRFLGDRLFFKHAIPLAGLMGAFYGDSGVTTPHTAISAGYDDALNSYLAIADNLSGLQANLAAQLMDVNLSSDPAAVASLDSFLSDKQKAYLSAHPGSKPNPASIADIDANRLIRGDSVPVFAAGLLGGEDRDVYGMERADLNSGRSAFVVKMKALYEAWVADPANIPLEVYKSNEAGFLAGAALSEVYFETADPLASVAKGGDLAKCIVSEFIRLRGVNPAGAAGYFKQQLQERVKAPSFKNDFKAFAARTNGDANPVWLAGGIQASLDNPAAFGSLADAFGLFSGKKGDGTAATRAEMAADGHLPSVAMRTFVAYLLGSLTNTSPLDNLIIAAFRANNNANFDLADGPAVAARVQDIVADYLAVQNGSFSAGDFLVKHKKLFAWIFFEQNSNPAVNTYALKKNLYGAQIAAIDALSQADHVVKFILKLKVDGSLLTVANEAQAFSTQANHGVESKPWVQAVFSAFHENTADPTWQDEFLGKIYEQVEAVPDIPYKGYLRLNNTAVPVGANKLAAIAEDFITLLNDRVPLKRNAALLAVFNALGQLKTGKDSPDANLQFGDHHNDNRDGRTVWGADFGALLDKCFGAVGSFSNTAVPADATKLSYWQNTPASRLRSFFKGIVALDAAGAGGGAPSADYTRFLMKFLYPVLVPEVQRKDFGPFDASLDGAALWAAGADADQRASLLIQFLNNALNAEVKTMLSGVDTNIKTAGADYDAFVGTVSGGLTNLGVSNAAVGYATDTNTFRGILYTGNMAYLGADVPVLTSVVPSVNAQDSGLLDQIRVHAFKRGGPDYLKKLYLASCFHDTIVANPGSLKAAGLKTAIANGLMDATAAIDHVPEKFQKFMMSCNKQVSGGGAALLLPTDVMLGFDGILDADGVAGSSWAATHTSIVNKLETYIKAKVDPTFFKGKGREYIAKTLLSTHDNTADVATNPLLLRLQNVLGADYNTRLPGLALMHRVLSGVDSSIMAIYRRAPALNTSNFEATYYRDHTKMLPSYAFSTYAWDINNEPAGLAHIKKYESEGLAKPANKSSELNAIAESIYKINSAAATEVSHAEEAVMNSYLFGCALENADLSGYFHHIFGAAESTWFTAAPGGCSWAYDIALPLDANKLQKQQAEWLKKLYARLNVIYGVEVKSPAGIADAAIAAGGGNYRTPQELFEALKFYAPVLLEDSVSVGADGADGVGGRGDDTKTLTFIQLHEQVVHFRSAQDAAHKIKGFIATNNAPGTRNEARARFASCVSARLLDYLYAGVRPSFVAPIMNSLLAALNEATPDWAGLVSDTNGLRDHLRLRHVNPNPMAAGIIGNLCLGVARDPVDIVLPTAESMSGAVPPAPPAPVASVSGGGGSAASVSSPKDKADVPEASPGTPAISVSEVPGASASSFAAAAASSASLSAIPETVTASVIAEKADTFVAEQMSYTAKKQVAPVDVKLAAGLASFSSAKNIDLSAKDPKKMKAAERLVWNALGKEQAKLKRVEAQLRRTKVNTAQYRKLRADKVAILNTAYKAAYAKEIAAKKRTLKAAPAKARVSVQRKPAFGTKKPGAPKAAPRAAAGKPGVKPTATATTATKGKTASKAAPKAAATAKPTAKPVGGNVGAPAKATTTTKPAAKPVAGKTPAAAVKAQAAPAKVAPAKAAPAKAAPAKAAPAKAAPAKAAVAKPAASTTKAAAAKATTTKPAAKPVGGNVGAPAKATTAKPAK